MTFLLGFLIGVVVGILGILGITAAMHSSRLSETERDHPDAY